MQATRQALHISTAVAAFGTSLTYGMTLTFGTSLALDTSLMAPEPEALTGSTILLEHRCGQLECR